MDAYGISEFAEIKCKRPFLARGLGFEAYGLPVPRQEFVEAAGGMTVGHALQDVAEPDKGFDVVELCGGDEGADGCPSDAATVRAATALDRSLDRIEFGDPPQGLGGDRWAGRLVQFRPRTSRSGLL